MRSIQILTVLIAFFSVGLSAMFAQGVTNPPASAQVSESQADSTRSSIAKRDSTVATEAGEPASATRVYMLVTSLTVFALAVFVGFEVITKVPPTLHTPLMSGSNAISGVTVIGAILVAGQGTGSGGFAAFIGMVAVLLAMINVVGGFMVTRRMLMMFKKR